MLIALTLLTAVVAAYALRRQHYLLGTSVALFGMYELLGPLLYYYDDGEFAQLMYLYNLVATDDLVNVHVELIATFLMFFLAGYLLLPLLIERIFSWNFASTFFETHEIVEDRQFKRFYILLVVLTIFGLISVSQGVGTQRLHDYLGYEYNVTPFYSYGTLLLCGTAPLIVYAVRTRQIAKLLLIILAILPIASQIFISSRRQFFAPLILFFVFYLLYKRGSVKRFAWLGAFLVVSIIFLGLQVQMRILITGVDYTNTDTATAVAVQVAEFIAISSTTLYSIVYVDPAYFTNFLHFIVMGVSNVIPYLKLGDLLFPDYTQGIQRMFETVAPFGGLSVIAESYASAGYVGVGVVAMLSGAIFQYGHLAWRAYSGNEAFLSPRLIFFASLICILILKYRSGFTDAFLTSVNFGLLYTACVVPAMFAEGRMRRDRSTSNLTIAPKFKR